MRCPAGGSRTNRVWLRGPYASCWSGMTGLGSEVAARTPGSACLMQCLVRTLLLTVLETVMKLAGLHYVNASLGTKQRCRPASH